MSRNDIKIMGTTESDPDILEAVRNQGRRGRMVIISPLGNNQHRIVGSQKTLDKAWAAYLKKTGN